MAHPPAGRRGRPGDKRRHGLLAILADPRGGFLLGRAADLADEDKCLRALVVGEQLYRVEVAGAVDGVAADADAGRLP